ILPNLKLLNRKGEWRISKALCLDAPGIDDEFLLDPEQGQILETLVASGRTHAAANIANPADVNIAAADLDHEVERTAKELLKYMQLWKPLVPPAAVGVVLCTCGNSKLLRKTAAE